MSHKWENVEAGEWCKQCGPLRGPLLQEFDPVTGADLGKFYTYFEVGTGQRKVPEREGQRRCNVFPRHIEEAITQWMVLRERWGGFLQGIAPMPWRRTWATRLYFAAS
jgi:hypothetical protein